jgi:hypothetical protein
MGSAKSGSTGLHAGQGGQARAAEPHWWQRLWQRDPAAREEPDAADLGTAFGLEMSLDEAPLPSSHGAAHPSR